MPAFPGTPSFRSPAARGMIPAGRRRVVGSLSSSFIAADGVRLHVKQGGEGPPVLLAVSPLKNVRYFREDMPGVPVKLIGGAGHFPQEEQPQVFNRHVLRFFLEEGAD